MVKQPVIVGIDPAGLGEKLASCVEILLEVREIGVFREARRALGIKSAALRVEALPMDLQHFFVVERYGKRLPDPNVLEKWAIVRHVEPKSEVGPARRGGFGISQIKFRSGGLCEPLFRQEGHLLNVAVFYLHERRCTVG